MPIAIRLPRGLAAAALLIVAFAPGGAAQHGGSEPSRPPLTHSTAPVGAGEAARWRADLAHLARELPAKHKNAFHTLSRAEWDAAVRELDGRIPSLARHQIVVELMRLVARIGDGHTSLPAYALPVAGFHALPYRVGVYADGIWVEGADRRYARAVGGRVLSIGGVPAGEALRRASTLVSRDTETWVRAVAPYLLNRAEVLHALGLADRLDAATLVVEKEGERRTIEVAALPGPSGDGMGLPFLPRLTADWVDARDGAAAPEPLWIQDRGRSYWKEYVPGHRLLYVQFNRTAEDRQETAADFFRGMREFIEANGVEKLVLDFRRNTGGEGFLTRHLVKEVVRATRVDRPGRLFAIIGPRTFSAGQLLANELERWTNVTFVGEPTGSTPNLYGNHEFVTLPQSGLAVAVAPAWFQTAEPNDRRPFTAPRVAARLTFADYRANRDPALEAVLAYDRRPTLARLLAEPLARGDQDGVRRAIAAFAADPANEFTGATGQANAAGYELLRNGRVDHALAVFRANVEVHPDYANGWDSLGEACEARGLLAEAAQAYRKAVALGFAPAAERLRRVEAHGST